MQHTMANNFNIIITFGCTSAIGVYTPISAVTNSTSTEGSSTLFLLSFMVLPRQKAQNAMAAAMYTIR